ncbi:MAG: site-2 protease family protein [Candidatus Thermoplasmatota archaeon]|nr:site-2 protease family protein [Candidatus Thermoplasmatota archaeon]
MERGLSLNQILFLGLLAWAGVRGWAPIWAIAIVGAWYFALVYLEQNGTLDRWNATRVLGIILMLRTGKGKVALEQLAKPRKLWRAYGEFSIWLCFIVMFGVILLIISAALATAAAPAEQNVLPASDLLLIPGVTSFVPLKWPLIALVIALIIHEYSHGIQARAHGMQVRSFGLLLAGPLPVGAFAEPEYEEMMRAPRRERIRLYAAGPSINLLATIVVLVLLSATANGFVAENPGVHATGIIKETGAEESGLLPYETITHIDDERVSDYQDFTEVMKNYSSGEVASFTVISLPTEGLETRVIEITFTDRWQYHMDQCQQTEGCDLEETERVMEELEIEQGDPFVGVSNLRSNTAAVDGWRFLADDDLSGMQKGLVLLVAPLVLLAIPIQFDGHTMPQQERSMLIAGDGVIASTLGTAGMLDTFDFLFWLAWINFLLGFANLIPMIPFDGGHIFRDAAHSTMRFIMRGGDPIRIENAANRLSSMSSLIVLFIVIIPIILPRLVS